MAAPTNQSTVYGVVGTSPASITSSIPVEKMDVIPGYETFIAGQAPVPPQLDAATSQPRQVDASQFQHTSLISTEQARSLLIQEVDAHCCWGKKAAQELAITSIESRSANHYSLESFAEKRSTEWRSEPYVGQIIDGPLNGRAPSPWEVFVQPPPPFSESKIDMEVPHTASVKPCFECHGRGKRDCPFCHHGHRDCPMCSQHNRSQCTHCDGSGRERCSSCHGHGHIECHSCRGCGSIKCYIVLHIHFKVHTSDFVQESTRSGLPAEKIKNAGGVVIFQDEAARVWPISNYPEPAINEASQNLVRDHATRIGAVERILVQRQRLRAVPVNACHFQYRDKFGDFYVYGTENAVHAPDYPQTCCCGCSIL